MDKTFDRKLEPETRTETRQETKDRNSLLMISFFYGDRQTFLLRSSGRKPFKLFQSLLVRAKNKTAQPETKKKRETSF